MTSVDQSPHTKAPSDAKLASREHDHGSRLDAGDFDGSNPLPTGSVPAADLPAKWVPFPTGSLPEPYATYVKEVAIARQCDPAAVAMPLLASLAGTIGNARKVQLGSDWLAPSVLWLTMVAPSGAVKSPGFEAAVAPVQEIDNAEWESWRKANVEYQTAQLAYQAELDDWRRAKKKTPQDPPVAPLEPILTRVVVEDTTMQALAGILADNPRGLLLARDELSGWVRSFDQFTGSKGADLSRWLEIYGAKPLRVDRKSDGHVHVPRAAVSICGTIQTDLLTEVFGHNEQASGLLARFLLAAPPERRRSWSRMRTAQPPDREALRARFRDLGALDLPQEGKPPVILVLSEEASDLYEAWFKSHESRSWNTEAGAWKSALAKLEEVPGRLGLVLALAGSTEPAMVKEVDSDAIRRAIEMTSWFVSEGERVYALMTETMSSRLDRELVEWVSQRDGTTPRDASRYLKRYRGPGGSKEAEDDLRRLAVSGRLRAEERPTTAKGGAPTVAYHRPAADADTTTAEREGFVGVGRDGTLQRTRTADDAQWEVDL
jgi:hypothetical protein